MNSVAFEERIIKIDKKRNLLDLGGLGLRSILDIQGLDSCLLFTSSSRTGLNNSRLLSFLIGNQ